MEAAAATAPRRSRAALLAAATVGALVAVALGIYGNVHDPPTTSRSRSASPTPSR
jgi:hypothetical protein